MVGHEEAPVQVKVEAYGAQVGGNLISTCDVFGLFFFIVLLKCIEVQFAGVSGFLYLGFSSSSLGPIRSLYLVI